jgi:hypothetical protein
MKLPKELLNGIFIAVGIAIFFLAMEVFGLSDKFYLRFLNILIVYYGVHRSLKSNIAEGKSGYVANLNSAGLTAFIGVGLSVASLVAYIYIKGGTAYLSTLSEGFLFGGKPSVNEYCIGLLIEAIASAVMVVFIAMQFWRSKTQTND